MQLPQTPDPLVVVGAAAVVIGVLILLVHLLRRRRRRYEPTGPTVVDWTSGAAIYGVGPWPVPIGATAPVDETRKHVPPAPPGASESEGERRDSVPPPEAARPAGAVGESSDASAAPWPAAGPQHRTDAAPSPELVGVAASRGAAGQAPSSPPDPAHHAAADPLIRGAHVPNEQSGSARSVAAAVAEAFAMRAAASRGATARPLGRRARLPTPPAPPPPRGGAPYETARTSPSEEDAEAVVVESEQATPSEPVRQYGPPASSHASDDHSPPSAPAGPEPDVRLPQAEEGSAEDTVPITPRREPASEDRPGSPVDPAPRYDDARDRLLAVLLADPARAVDATEELAACLIRLAELSDAMRRERGVLRALLHRLAAAGLSPEQSARLAGIPLADVHELLAAAPSQGPS